jgi:hypothetical protein
MDAIKLLEQERKIASGKFYLCCKKVREGENKNSRAHKLLKEERDFYGNSEIVISRLIELLNNEREGK